MRKLVFVLDMPHGNAYVGGVASMVNKYIEYRNIFHEHGYQPEILDLSNCNKKIFSISKVNNILNMFRQAVYVRSYVKKNPEIYLHIHTSIKWTFFKDLFIILCARRYLNGKLCLTIHHAEPNNFFYGYLGEQCGIKILKHYVDKIIVLSERTKEYFVSKGISEKQLLMLYTFHCYETNDNSLIEETKDMIFMGPINHWKGVFELLDAIEHTNHKDYLLHVCGVFPDSTTEKEFRNHSAFKSGRVILHGYVTGEEKKKLLQKSAILSLPSHAEGMPISIMEGMALGCAILATRVGSIPEVIKKENGILVEPYDIRGIEKAINEMLDNPAELCRMQLNNIQYSRQFYISEHITKMLRFFESVE